MGTYLSKLVTDKEYDSGENDFLSFASCSMQGWRASQEDSLNCIINFDEAISLFAVYDGHGGKEVSQLCSLKLPEIIRNCEQFIKGNYADALVESFLSFDKSIITLEIQNILLKLASHVTDNDYENEDLKLLKKEALIPLPELLGNYKINDDDNDDETSKLNFDNISKQSKDSAETENMTETIDDVLDDAESDEEFVFEEGSDTDDSDDISSEDDICENTDEKVQTMHDIYSTPGFSSGSTALVTVIDRKKMKIYVANAGDSRCVLCRNGRAVDLSIDHKPVDAKERKRITRAGGVLGADGRINGGLNLSRSIGDHGYKKNKAIDLKDQMISALPDIMTIDLKPEIDEFLVLACDGIWGTFSSKELIEFIKRRMTTVDLKDLIGQIFNHCLAPTTVNGGPGCDNMTCAIVTFNSDGDTSVTGLSNKARATKRTVESPDTGDSTLPPKSAKAHT